MSYEGMSKGKAVRQGSQRRSPCTFDFRFVPRIMTKPKPGAAGRT